MIGTLTEYVSEALWLLNIGRILEAGGLIFMILNGVLLRDTLDDPKERARAFAGIIIASSIGSLLAPILAEVSLLSWGWHAVFLSILVLGAILFIFAYLRLPETTPTPNPKRAPLYIVAKQMIMDPRIIWLTLLYILYVGFFQLFFVQLSRLLVDQRGIPDKFFVLFFAVITLGCLFGSFGSKRLRHWRDEYSIAHFALLAPILGFFTLIFCGLLLLVWSPPLWLSIGLILLAFFEALIGYGLAVPNILSIILVDYRSTNAFSSSFYRFLWSLGVALETTLLSHLPSGKKLLVLYFGILTGLIIVLTVACRRYFQISKKT
jgi:predicted MFS family arabinose efflux permease